MAIWRRGSELFAEVVAPGEAGVAVDRMGMHPAVLDAVLHALGLAVEKTQASTETRLPFCWRGVSLHAGGAGRVRARFASAGADAISVDVCDATGLPVLTVRSLVTRPITAEQLRAAVTAAGGASDQGPLEVVWSPISVVSGGANGSAPPAPVSWADFCAGSDGDASVVVWELESAGGQASSVVGSVYAATHTALEVLQSWLGADRAATLVVLTHGGVGLAGEDISDLAAAAVWGMARSAQAENPGRIVLIDTDAAVDASVLAGVGEPQLLVRGGTVHAPRLSPAPALLALPAAESAWRLAAGGGGTLEDLVIRPCPEVQAPLQAGQVRVAVAAVGVNFRDVVAALGMYPGQAPPLGAEGAGVVLETGPEVTDLAVGDAVMGFLGGAGPLAVVDQQLVTRVPQGWSFAQAAAVPVVFLTAWYGLADLAEIKAGESVLIHAGTGGVGMAAVQLARQWGVEVFVTASVASGTRCAPWGLTTTISAIPAHASSRRSSWRSPRAAGLMWCSTRWPVSSWMRRCAYWSAVGVSSRWARRISAMRRRSPLIIPACSIGRSTCRRPARHACRRCWPRCGSCSTPGSCTGYRSPRGMCAAPRRPSGS